MRLSLLLFFSLFTLYLNAQCDTNYYRQYDDKFIVSLHNSFARQYDISFDQRMSKDTNITKKSPFHYYAEGDVISGIEIDYDIFGISFDYKAVPPKDVNRKGKTEYTDLGLSIGKQKWKLDLSYKMYEGFYDLNTKTYTPSFDSTSSYYQNPSMSTRCTKAKFMYITNTKRFAYDAAYSCSDRQIKTAFSWIFVGNLYSNQIRTDSSFVPYPIRSLYSNFADFNGLRVVGLSAGAGFSVNFVVFHRIFYNFTLAVEPESQWREYHFASGFTTSRNYLRTSADLRASLGYNGKKFFAFLSGIGDYSNYSSGQLMITNSFVSGSFTLGYRFTIKKPKFYKNFEKTKLYQMF